jgi:hypothetical protein
MYIKFRHFYLIRSRDYACAYTMPHPVIIIIMIVVETGQAHVMKFLPISCEISIFVAVTVIF